MCWFTLMYKHVCELTKAFKSSSKSSSAIRCKRVGAQKWRWKTSLTTSTEITIYQKTFFSTPMTKVLKFWPIPLQKNDSNKCNHELIKGYNSPKKIHQKCFVLIVRKQEKPLLSIFTSTFCRLIEIFARLCVVIESIFLLHDALTTITKCSSSENTYSYYYGICILSIS